MEVKVTDVDTNTQKWKEKVVMDWSYDYGEDIDTNGVSAPITGEVHPYQVLMRTLLQSPHPVTINVKAYAADGTSTTTAEQTDLDDGYWGDSDLLRRLVAAGSGTFCLDIDNEGYSSKVALEVDGYKYTFNACADYVLYYINAYGGWDSLLMHGRMKAEDALTRHSIGIDYDNTYPYHRGRVNYATEVQRKFTIHTGWLTDDQSGRMHHLLNSQCVYLHDIASGDIVPVVLTNTNTEYKTYLNQGARMVDYTITADLAVDMMRQ